MTLQWQTQKGHSLPLTTTFLQKFTELHKGISYPVGDRCRCFTKLTWPSGFTLHSNLIPTPDGTNGLLQFVTYNSQTAIFFAACSCHPTVGNFDISPLKDT